MVVLNVFGVATLYARDLAETCLRLGVKANFVNNLREPGVWIPGVLEEFDSSSGPCVVAPSGPKARARAALNAFALGARRFENLVDPTSTLPSELALGCGNYINAMVAIGSGSRIDCHCNVNRSANIGHHNRLQSFCSVGPGATLCGSVTIGVGTLVGGGATVLPEVTIGMNVTIGAGAVVTKNVPDGMVVVGNPARAVGENQPWTEELSCPVC
jgi:sugar O-acyltransferase (sialic acid O-acetyltransferase NeuD family)